MSARLADESGFTLVELLATMVVAGIILFALFGLVDVATRQQSVATDRIDTNDRARVAMDTVSTQLRSRACLSGIQGSIISASPTELEFYASLGLTGDTTVTQQPIIQRRRLTYSPGNKDLVEKMWVSDAVPPVLPPEGEENVTRERTLLTNVTVPAGTTFFDYWALGDAESGLPLETATHIGSTLSATNLADQTRLNVRIDVGFEANGRVLDVKTPMKTEILDRSPGCFFG